MNERLETPTEEDVRLAFAKSKRKVYVRHLFSKEEEKLSNYYQRLETGENFVDLANEFYETPEYDSTAGYLGPISYYGIDDNFAETAFSINEGGHSEPIRTSFGYHIIYVEKVLFEAMLT
jgi:parvulin-like peptidyl-prolyl isomerase